MLKFLLVGLIRFYQNFLSLETGRAKFLLVFFLGASSHKACCYSPTCSEYTYQAIEKYGAWVGLKLGIKRIVRCRPGVLGGYDPCI